MTEPRCRYCRRPADENSDVAICWECWGEVSRIAPFGTPALVHLHDGPFVFRASKNAAVCYRPGAVVPHEANPHDALTARWLFSRDWKECGTWYELSEQFMRGHVDGFDVAIFSDDCPELCVDIFLRVLDLVPHAPVINFGIQGANRAVFFCDEECDWMAAIMPLREDR